MIRCHGVGASRGIAIGPAHLTEVRVSVAERRILRHDREAELARLEAASEAAEEQLERLRRQLSDVPGGTGLEIVDLHALIIRSPSSEGEARRLINDECFAAEWAVTRALEQIRATFARLDDAYFRERAGDFDAATDRLLRVLIGLPELRSDANTPRGAVAVGVDLGPLESVSPPAIRHRGDGRRERRTDVARGDHRARFRPALRRRRARRHGEGPSRRDDHRRRKPGRGGRRTRRRDRARLPRPGRRGARARAADERHAQPGLRHERRRPVHLGANVESLAGVSAAFAAGAESIGLFRTEFLYLERPDLPSEQEQFEDAVAAVRSAHGLPITFRTLDLGADKLPPSVKIPAGPNPALGYDRRVSRCSGRTS
jgi:phosphotransferase system enzyme I (PtsI)